MVTVEVDGGSVESRLAAGGVLCPSCAVGVLARWGFARRRRVTGTGEPVRPRRGRCRGCGATHVLLPVSLLLRRAYAAEWVWGALAARAGGAGCGSIAARWGVPASTVRGWVRRMGGRLGQVRAWFVALAIGAGVDVRVPAASGSGWADALGAIGLAWSVLGSRFGAGGLFGVVTAARVAVAGSGGRLLSPGWPPVVLAHTPTPLAPAGIG